MRTQTTLVRKRELVGAQHLPIVTHARAGNRTLFGSLGTSNN